MKHRLPLLSAAFVLVSAFALALAAPVQDGPINAMCPIMQDKKPKKGITVKYDGKVIGLCCSSCLGKWQKDPEKWAKNVPELKAKPKPGAPGQPAPDFTVEDTAAKAVKLADFKGRIAVFVWIDADDSVSKRLGKAGAFTRVPADLKAVKDDIAFVPVCSTSTVEAAKLTAWLAEQKYEGAALIDKDGTMGKAFGITNNTQTVVVDKDGVVRYSGAFDNDESGRKGASATSYAVEAAKALASGGKVETETTKPYGGTVKYKR
jgi:peroxiredoxin